jgi:thymidylate synthase ThyX
MSWWDCYYQGEHPAKDNMSVLSESVNEQTGALVKGEIIDFMIENMFSLFIIRRLSRIRIASYLVC